VLTSESLSWFKDDEVFFEIFLKIFIKLFVGERKEIYVAFGWN